MSATAGNRISEAESTSVIREPRYESTVETIVDPADSFLVTFDKGDPEDPLNWSRSWRWYLTLLSGILILNATFAGAAPTNISLATMEYFGYGEEVSDLVISVFIAGYCVGPLLWAPLSEHIGRRPVFILSFVVYIGFQVGCALSRNTASIIVFRFLTGAFAAAPLTNSGAVVGDIWDPRTRGKGMTLYSVAPFGGPALGPVVSGWVQQSGTSWRWLYWILTIVAGVCAIAVIFTLDETYRPVILVKKAARLRKETGDSRYYAPMEQHKLPFAQLVNNILARPFQVLFQEPILIALTLYTGFVYGCLYLLFEAYPIVFSRDHGLNPGVMGLMFLPIFFGAAIGCTIHVLYFNRRYVKLLDHYAPRTPPPEAHLDSTLFAAPLYAISFFWFGWTSYASISYWSSMMSGGLMGFALAFIFLSLTNYIVNMYLSVAASALASFTVVRSIFGAVFPLFATQMFDSLNPRWASTLLGGVALIMAPIPFLLIRYGPTLRAKSRFAPNLTGTTAIAKERTSREKGSPDTGVSV